MKLKWGTEVRRIFKKALARMRNRDYWAAHKFRISQRRKERGATTTQCKRYYWRYRDKILAKRAAKREVLRQRYREWYARNREKVIAQVREYKRTRARRRSLESAVNRQSARLSKLISALGLIDKGEA